VLEYFGKRRNLPGADSGSFWRMGLKPYKRRPHPFTFEYFRGGSGATSGSGLVRVIRAEKRGAEMAKGKVYLVEGF
jgi:hypothetical protein